jgi:mannose-1-phosphate guanylyltransferase
MINSTADTFVVVEGTVLPQVNVAELLAAHRGSGAALTVVVTDRELGRRGCETQVERLEPAGVYVFSTAVLSHVPARGYQDIKETLIPLLYSKGLRLSAHVVGSDQTPRVTNAASYMAMSKWALERLAADGSAPEGYVRLGDAVIHESARLRDSARFIGPVLIGPQSRIEEDAMVIGPTSVGAGCVIERQAVVSRSMLWTSCHVGPGAVLDHCILTDAATVREEMVIRETVCLARPHRWSWTDQVRSLVRRTRSRPTVTYVPAACPVLPSSKAKSPNVIIRSDLRRVAASPAVHGAREGDR